MQSVLTLGSSLPADFSENKTLHQISLLPSQDQLNQA
jgi:hypothetical protein